MTRMTEDSVYGPPMTPAPKDAPSSAKATEGRPAEPDWDEIGLQAGILEPGQRMPDFGRAIMRAGYAAGQHSSCEASPSAKATEDRSAKQEAAPQPEGEEITAMLADLRARGLHDAAEMLAVTEYGYRKLCEANDTLGKLVPQQTLRIAALEAALREARTELFALCEDTETHCASIAEQDTEHKIGAFARGRIREAKSIRSAMGEVFRKLLTPTSGAAEGKGEEG